MTSLTRTMLGIGLILVITFCGTFIFSKLSERWGGWDLTEDSLYTLSEGSQKIVEALPRPLTMKLFYSKEAATKVGADQFRQFHNYYYYVRDLLRAYERRSGGKLALFEYDPRPYSDEAIEADRLGIRRWPLTETEGFYFGLSVTSGGGAKEVIPTFDLRPAAQAQLEFKISELIDIASRRKKTKIGVLSSLSITGGGMDPYMQRMMQMQGRQPERAWNTVDRLKKFYEVEDVANDTDSIDESIDYLLVVHPKQLADTTLYAIDQFVMRGGKLIAFVDPHCFFADQPPQQPNNPFGGAQHDKSSELNKLTAAWGVELETGKFAGDFEIAQRVPDQRAGQMVRFPAGLAIAGSSLNQEEIVTADLDQVDAWFAGALRRKDGVEGVTITPLMKTTDKGNTWTASSFELGGPMGLDVARLASKFKPGVDELWIAAKVGGKFKSAFPDGKPKSADPEDPATGEENPDEAGPPQPDADTHVAECTDDNAFIVVADVDIITDGAAWRDSFFGPSMVNANVAFLQNSLDFLAGSDALISIRARKQFNRRFDVVDEIEKEADRATETKVRRIQEEIEAFNTELRDLNSKATTENVGLLQSEAYDKERKLEAQIRAKEAELRDVQKAKLDAIESLGASIKNLNTFGVPMLVAIIGLLLFYVRVNKRRAQVRGGVA